MTANASCRTCRHFEAPPALSPIGASGWCHFNPPVTTPILMPAPPQGVRVEFLTAWPSVQTSDWCAQHTSALEMQ